ncbi:MAG: mandelate racemase/muconate lactonizing enzyme family protein, partial [bacterium]|nr:mandelate racemase/muconate lactonizing enzyme family protein [bacterium]
MKRRSFLGGAVAAPLMPMAAQVGSQPSMKITDIKTFLVHTTPVSDNQPSGRNWVLVKVETDQGIHGIGEAYSCGPDEATVKVIEDYKSWLVGQDPRNIEHIWSLMYNITRFPGGSVVNSAISGIDHALWDIAGKAVGLPVYMLLGGKVRDKIRLYQSAGGGEPSQVAETAKRLVEKYGYTAVKMSPHMSGTSRKPYNYVTRMAGERVKAVRDALGPDVDIGVDIHAKFF